MNFVLGYLRRRASSKIYHEPRSVYVQHVLRMMETYLTSKLPRRADDQDERLCTDFVGERVVADRVGARRSELTGLAHELGQNREEERSSLAGT